ncbi:hypothetical protein [Frankia sp. Cr2]|uniref:hypothetical protein n=1 Tax=Frankia sp. Cr2 TaxID=3073932 RepID=UPI002AD4D8C5|nr:hypothetical protein [Frankia sp. Cr2]
MALNPDPPASGQGRHPFGVHEIRPDEVPVPQASPLPEPSPQEPTPPDAIPIPQNGSAIRPDSSTGPDGSADSAGLSAQVVELAGRFGSASAALVFAGSLVATGHRDSIQFLRADGPEEPSGVPTVAGSGGWWVAVEMALDLGRELVSTASGRLFVHADGWFRPDRGWGATPVAPVASVISDGDRGAVPTFGLRPVSVVEVVRTAGLHPVAAGTSTEAVVLLPGALAGEVIQRALELGLSVSYRPVRLDPLFDAPLHDTPLPGAAAGPFGGGRVATELRLSPASGEALPASLPMSLLTALNRDPFMLVCRATGDGLLVQHAMASALPDPVLADLLLADLVDTGTWVLADSSFGCWRLVGLGEPSDGAALVRLADGYPLEPPDRTIPVPDTTSLRLDGRLDGRPDGQPVAIVPGRTSGVDIAAALLDDADLAGVPPLLEGHPLAEIAFVVRGRDRHLLLAPGGLLERLPVGEPLYRLGPGPLFLPVGYRTRPRLPETARQALFGAVDDVAVVALPDRAVAFDLRARQPVWTLWAGPGPDLDLQLPPETVAALADVDAQVTPRPPEAVPVAAPTPQPPAGGVQRARELWKRLRNRVSAAPSAPRTWLDDALEAELADNLVGAAALHERNGDPLRAAHLYERAARQNGAPTSP